MGGPLLTEIEFRDLPRRRITETTCNKFGYAVGTYRGQRVHVAPYFDSDGVMVAQKIRFPDKDFRVLGDLSRAGLFGQHLWRDNGKKVVITEGEIDAMSVSQLQENKWPVVSIARGAGGAVKDILAQLEWLERFEDVVFMFDMDEAGQDAAKQCALLLSPGKAKLAALPRKDANECLVNGLGPAVIDAMWQAKVYRPDGIVTGDEVWDYMTRANTTFAVNLPHSGLNAKTRGFRLGEVLTITGGTGIGKSLLMREIAYAIMEQNERIGYIALEEPVGRTAIGMCSIALNKPLHLDLSAVSAEALRETFDKLKERVVYYDHFGSTDSANLIAKIRYMVRGAGCRYVFLDHLSIVVSGLEETDERRAIDIAMTKLSKLAQELSCGIAIVCHLKKADGTPHEEGRAVSMGDLRGSHGIAQLSHTIVSAERNQQDEVSKDISTVRVIKCRHTGDTGIAGNMRYDRDTGRMLEFEVGFDDVPADGVAHEAEDDF